MIIYWPCVALHSARRLHAHESLPSFAPVRKDSLNTFLLLDKHCLLHQGRLYRGISGDAAAKLTAAVSHDGISRLAVAHGDKSYHPF